MFLELLRKEFIELKSESQPSLLLNLLSLSVKVLFVSFFVFVEVLIAVNISKKIEIYSTYSSYDFLVLFLFVFMIGGILFTTENARKVLFKECDRQVNTPLPISTSSILLSKATFLYIESVLLQFLLSVPLFFCYGIKNHFIPYYYIFSMLYPFFLSFFICGVSYLLVLFYQKIYVLIKKYSLVQFLLAIGIVFFACYLYQFVLNLFLNALSDSSLGGMFSSSFVSALHSLAKYLAPVSFYCDLLIQKDQILSSLCLFFGLSLLSVVIGLGSLSFFYKKIMKDEKKEGMEKKYRRKSKLSSPMKAYLKKEFYILFRDENNLFSYTSLLILCPFLTYVVINSLNQILYDNLRFYASYFPELVNGINMTLILLFALVIHASSSFSMSREGKALKIAKTIPLSIKKQLFCKMMLPFLASFLSLLVTLVLLLSFQLIPMKVFFSSLFAGTILFLFSDVYGIYTDMHDLNKENKIRLKVFVEILPLIYPLFLFLFFFLGSILFKMNSALLYLIFCLFTVLFVLPFVIYVYFHCKKAFVEMEVSN